MTGVRTFIRKLTTPEYANASFSECMVAIVFGVIYKLFEQFAGRRERMMLIEKMGDKLTPETFKNGIMYRPSLYSFGGLRIGCLLLGLGAGLLVGYMLACTTQPDYLSDNYPYTVKET